MMVAAAAATAATPLHAAGERRAPAVREGLMLAVSDAVPVVDADGVTVPLGDGGAHTPEQLKHSRPQDVTLASAATCVQPG